MYQELEEFLSTAGTVEASNFITFPPCSLCGDPLLDGELAAHKDCHRAEHLRAYLQDEEVFS